MQTSNKKKSSWFLTIVAFVMVFFLVGYIFSCTLWNTTLAKEIWNYDISTNIKTEPENLQSKEEQDNTFADVETSIAQRAVSWRNKLVGNNDSTSYLTVNLPSKEADTAIWENVASWYKDISTTNTANWSVQLTFANGIFLPSIYQDISTSSYQDAITVLYSNGILQSNNMFYPHNYVRISDFIRVVMDAYRVQLGDDPHSLVGLTNNFYISDSSFDSEVLMRVNTAYELWFLQSFALEDSEWNIRLNEFITPQEAKNILTMMQKKNPSLNQNIPNIYFVSNSTLRKDEMAELVVSALWLKLNEWSLAMFSDISWSTYQNEIQLLAKLGIIWWVDGKFYPNAKIENKDFVIMIVRALMRQSDSKPSIDNFYYITHLLYDTNSSYNATYSPYLEFCLESQICNSLLSQTSKWVLFEPNRLLSQWEVASVLSISTKNQFIIAWDWSQTITRWEVAKLIVDAFWFNQSPSTITNSTEVINNLETSSWSQKTTSSLRENFQNLMKIS